MMTRAAERRSRSLQDAVDAGDADVVEPLDAIAHQVGGDRRFLGDRDIRRAGRRDGDRALAGRRPHACTVIARAVAWYSASGMRRARTLPGGFVRAGHEQRMPALDDAGGDGRDLVGRLAEARGSPRESPAGSSGDDRRGRSPRSSIRLLAQCRRAVALCASSVVTTPCADRVEQGPQLGWCHAAIHPVSLTLPELEHIIVHCAYAIRDLTVHDAR